VNSYIKFTFVIIAAVLASGVLAWLAIGSTGVRAALIVGIAMITAALLRLR